MSDEELKRLVAVFKVLSDESRLRILGILGRGRRTGGELAELLGLRASTVSHHLARLREVGLLHAEPEGNLRYYVLDDEANALLDAGLLSPGELARIVPEARPGTFEDKVLSTFVEGGQLVKIPSSRKKRDVVLRWLADLFEPDVAYTEGQVNERIPHWDSATLRRELVGAGLLARTDGIYTRVG